MKWSSTFEMIRVSIIYSVHIIIIADILGGFMISGALRSLKIYLIPNEYFRISDKDIYCIAIHIKLPSSHLLGIFSLITLPIFGVLFIYQLILHAEFVMKISRSRYCYNISSYIFIYI